MKRQKDIHVRTCLREGCDITFEVDLNSPKRQKKYCSHKCHLTACNPMQRSEVAEKASVTRSKRFKEDPNFSKLVSEYTCKAWASGKYDGVKTGKCKWYAHVKPNGETCKLQGTWEVALARWYDKHGVEYVAHRGRIEYDDHGTKRSYYPDFFLPLTETYVDVKGAFWDWKQREKFDLIRKSNPGMKLDLLTRTELDNMGVDIDSTQSELLQNNSLREDYLRMCKEDSWLNTTHLAGDPMCNSC